MCGCLAAAVLVGCGSDTAEVRGSPDPVATPETATAPSETSPTVQTEANPATNDSATAADSAPGPGPLGGDQLNDLAAHCFARDETCPSGQAAVVIRGVIVTAPAFAEPAFRGELQISADFSEAEAREIARTLRLGATGGA